MLPRVEDRRERVDVDEDSFRGILRAAQVLGDDDSDRLSHEAHALSRETRACHHFGDGGPRRRRHPGKTGKVRGCPRPEHARHRPSLGQIDAAKLAVG